MVALVFNHTWLCKNLKGLILYAWFCMCGFLGLFWWVWLICFKVFSWRKLLWYIIVVVNVLTKLKRGWFLALVWVWKLSSYSRFTKKYCIMHVGYWLYWLINYYAIYESVELLLSCVLITDLLQTILIIIIGI